MTLNEALDALEKAGRIKSRWLPGMRDVRGMRVFVAGSCPVGVEDGDTRVRPNVRALRHNAVHDLSDPLTVMGLLLLAREAWNAPLSVRAVGVFMGGGLEWAVCDTNSPAHPAEMLGFAYESEAITAAIIAAAEGL